MIHDEFWGAADLDFRDIEICDEDFPLRPIVGACSSARGSLTFSA